jgi:hypothetical protein
MEKKNLFADLENYLKNSFNKEEDSDVYILCVDDKNNSTKKIFAHKVIINSRW